MTALNTTDLRSKIVVPRNERLIVALDVADAAEARALVEQLGDSVSFTKWAWNCLWPVATLS